MAFLLPPAGRDGKAEPIAKSKVEALLVVEPAVKPVSSMVRNSAFVDSLSLLMTRAITGLVMSALSSFVVLVMISRTRSS